MGKSKQELRSSESHSDEEIRAKFIIGRGKACQDCLEWIPRGTYSSYRYLHVILAVSKIFKVLPINAWVVEDVQKWHGHDEESKEEEEEKDIKEKKWSRQDRWWIACIQLTLLRRQNAFSLVNVLVYAVTDLKSTWPRMQYALLHRFQSAYYIQCVQYIIVIKLHELQKYRRTMSIRAHQNHKNSNKIVQKRTKVQIFLRNVKEYNLHFRINFHL